MVSNGKKERGSTLEIAVVPCAPKVETVQKYSSWAKWNCTKERTCVCVVQKKNRDSCDSKSLDEMKLYEQKERQIASINFVFVNRIH
jgi:hypothetical protein